MTDHVIITPTLQSGMNPAGLRNNIPPPPPPPGNATNSVRVEPSKSGAIIGLVKKYKFYILAVVLVIIILFLCYRFASKDTKEVEETAEPGKAGGTDKPEKIETKPPKPSDEQVRDAAQKIDDLAKTPPAPSPAKLETPEVVAEPTATHQGESDADFERRMLVSGKVDVYDDKL